MTQNSWYSQKLILRNFFSASLKYKYVQIQKSFDYFRLSRWRLPREILRISASRKELGFFSSQFNDFLSQGKVLRIHLMKASKEFELWWDMKNQSSGVYLWNKRWGKWTTFSWRSQKSSRKEENSSVTKFVGIPRAASSVDKHRQMTRQFD